MADVVKASKRVALSENPTIWDFDFTNDLRTGESVSSATATHRPPSGSASTPTVGTIAANVVPVQLGALTVTGTHFLDVLATLVGGRKTLMRLEFDVTLP